MKSSVFKGEAGGEGGRGIRTKETHLPDGEQKLDDRHEQTYRKVQDEPESHLGYDRRQAFVSPERSDRDEHRVPHRRPFGKTFAAGHLLCHVILFVSKLKKKYLRKIFYSIITYQ